MKTVHVKESGSKALRYIKSKERLSNAQAFPQQGKVQNIYECKPCLDKTRQCSCGYAFIRDTKTWCSLNGRQADSFRGCQK